MPYARFGDCRHNVEGGHKNAIVNGGSLTFKSKSLRCVLTQDVERMPYALCLIVIGILVGESTRVDLQI